MLATKELLEMNAVLVPNTSTPKKKPLRSLLVPDKMTFRKTIGAPTGSALKKPRDTQGDQSQPRRNQHATIDPDNRKPHFEQPHCDARLAHLTSSPFTKDIDGVSPPKGFTQPKFVKYDEESDAYTHLVQYKM